MTSLLSDAEAGVTASDVAAKAAANAKVFIRMDFPLQN
jgi:hypothetical protein